MLKRTVSLLTALLILVGICACSSGSEEKKETKVDDFSMKNVITYDEKEIGSTIGFNSPGMRLDMDSNNNIILNDNRKKESFCIISDSAGKKIKEYKNDTVAGYVSFLTLDAKDNRYVVYEKYQKKDSSSSEVTYTLVIYNAKGEKQKSIEIGKRTITQEQSGFTDIAVDSKGSVYLLLRKNAIWVIGADGKKIKEIPAKKTDYIEIDEEDKLLTGSFNGSNSHSLIEKLNVEKGDSIWTKEVAVGNYVREMKYSFKNRKIYLLTDKGILCCSNEGRFEGFIFDLKQSSLIDSGIYMCDFIVDNNLNLYILVFTNLESSNSSKSKSLLYKYTPAKDQKKNKNQKTLSIALRYSEKFIEAAIAKFQKEHPEIKVDVKDYSAATMGTSEEELARAKKAEEDYQKVISTELMAGSGTDIIDVLGLPDRRFAEKNVLENLSETIRNDKSFELNNYRQELFNACKYKGNLYIMPINFSFNRFCVNKSIMKNEGLNFDSTKWTWREFLDIAKKVTKDKNGDGKPDQYALPKMDTREIFGYMLEPKYQKFIDFDKKTANFDSAEFVSILKFAKEFSEKNVCSPKLDISEMYQMKDPGTIGFMMSYFGNYQSTVMQQGLFNGEVEYLNMPTFSGKPDPKEFILNRTFAISKNSKMKSEAWAFIKMLLSDGIQSASEMYNFPVNSKALKTKAAEEISRNYIYEANKYQNKGRNIKPLKQEGVDLANRMMGELNVIPYSEAQAGKIISEGAEEYFSGKKSAEEAAKIIQSKISIYLGE